MTAVETDVERWRDFDVVGYATDPDHMLPVQLRRWAERDPGRPYLLEVGGRTATYGETWALVRRWVSWLRARGVERGDHVATVLPPSIDAALVWVALSCLGAVEVPVNPELAGEFMSHVLDDAAPVLCLARPELVERISASRPNLRIVEVGRESDPLADVEPAELAWLPGPADVSCVIYTSGTSGPAKGVVIRWAQFAAVVGRMPLLESDVSYACFPMFHVTGRTPLVTMSDVGGRVVFRERLSLRSVLDDVRSFGCTTGTFPAGLLLTLPPEPGATYPFRMVFTGHGTELNEQFGERFGVRGYDCYGSTEVGFPIVRLEAPPDRRRMWCGKVRPGYEAKVVDEQGRAVPDGQAGELWLCAGDRLMVMSHYLNNPSATANTFDGEWYRTGDIVIRHPDGNVEFLDRAKDTIRRMGENISTTAVEAVLEAHPDVAAAAVVGVPDRIAGHEVLMVVEPAEVRSIEPAAFYEWLRDRVPRHALPRYLLVMTLPRTPTQKVLKRGLLDAVDLADAWSPPARR